ncbi:MAG: cell division protein SepF, partial [Nanoarchaeota archaeon]
MDIKMGALDRFREKIFGERREESFDETAGDYMEINTPEQGTKTKVIVKPFVIHDFQDIKPAIDSLREGYTIGLVNIRPLKEKDIVELKRAISKLKKTCDAVDGDIAGFGEDWIVITPSFVEVHRHPSAPNLRSRS